MQCLKDREHFGSSVMPTTLEVPYTDLDLPFIKSPTHQPLWPRWFWGSCLANSNCFSWTLILILAVVFLSPSAVCSHLSIMHFGPQHQKTSLPPALNDWIRAPNSHTCPFLMWSAAFQNVLLCICWLENQCITWKKQTYFAGFSRPRALTSIYLLFLMETEGMAHLWDL